MVVADQGEEIQRRCSGTRQAPLVNNGFVLCPACPFFFPFFHFHPSDSLARTPAQPSPLGVLLPNGPVVCVPKGKRHLHARGSDQAVLRPEGAGAMIMRRHNDNDDNL